MEKKDYICIHKQVIKSDVFRDSDVYRVFTWILVNCQDEPCKMMLEANRHFIEIEADVGDCIFLLKHVTEDLAASRFVVSRCIKQLEQLDIVRCTKEGRYTKCVVVNYREYQTVRLENFCDDPQVHAWYQDEMPNVAFDPRDVYFPARLASAKLGGVWVEWCDVNDEQGTPMSKPDAEKQLIYILKKCSCAEAISRLQQAIAKLRKEKQQSEKPSKERRKKTRSEVSKQLKDGKPAYSDEFTDFWLSFPNHRRGSKPEAVRRFNENCSFLVRESFVECDGKRYAFENTTRAAAFLVERAKVYASSLNGKGKFAKGAAAWLNNHNYLDSRESWESLSGTSDQKPNNKFQVWE